MTRAQRINAGYDKIWEKKANQDHARLKAEASNPETLIVYPWGNGIFSRGMLWAVKDITGNHIGTFNSKEAAETWCRDNGYRSRVETSADVRKQQ